MEELIVSFLPKNISIKVAAGCSVAEAAVKAGLPLKSTCGGDGTCGQCAVKVVAGKTHTAGGKLPARLEEQGYTLACQTFIYEDAIIEIPARTLLRKHQLLFQDKERLQDSLTDILGPYPFQPVCELVKINLPEPSLTENNSDMGRLLAALHREKGLCGQLGLSVLKGLPDTLRQSNWQVDVTLEKLANNILRVTPSGLTRNYGLAIDLGTTTVAVSLLDLSNGHRVACNGSYNRQAAYGDDVISRVIHAIDKSNGLDTLRQVALTTINDIIEAMLTAEGIEKEEIVAASIAGNTIMTHLLLGVNPKYIRLQPYIPAAAEWPPMTASEVGLEINSMAPIYVFPAIASYVGGDIVAGALFAQNARKDKHKLNLFIDIGTNGEMVLGNNDWLISCACSAGPAFEGSGITNGMRAMTGAIEAVNIDPETHDVILEVIGNGVPAGICGSGLIDCLAKLRRSGLIDRRGNFIKADTPRLKHTDEGYEFVLSWADENSLGRDIVITDADIKNLIRSKGAVFAGIQSLLKTVSLELETVDRIIIAGGFGNYLNIANAVEIGLLPDVPQEKYVFAGNTSLKGAELVLLSRLAWQEALELANRMTYLELSVGNVFMEEFVAALFLPHTKLELFPSILNGNSTGGG